MLRPPGGLATTESSRVDGRALAAFTAVVVLLGVNFVGVSVSNRELAPFWGASLRFVAASVLLFGIVAARRISLPRGGALRGSIVAGALGFGGAYALIYWGLVSVPAGVASVIFATVPLSTFLLAVALRMEKFRRMGLVGAVVVILGVAAMSYEQFAGDVDPLPLVAVILSAIAATCAGIVVKRAPRSHPAAFNAVAMGVGAVILLAASLSTGEGRAVPQLGATWVAVAYLVFSTATAFMLWVWIIARWTISAVAYQAVLSPLVTVAVASVVLAEPVTAALAVGTALVLGGVYVGTARPKPPPASAAPPAEQPLK